MSRTWDIVGLRNNRPVVVATVKELELHDEWMGECFLTVTVKSAGPVEFKVGDYIDYRGERYTIDYDPTVLKKARRSSYGEGFVYDNIKFYSYSHELTFCDFCDYVLYDNNIHFSSLAKFSFFASTVSDLADRIQANLTRFYGDAWTVVCGDMSGDTDALGNKVVRDVNVSVSDIKVWDALALVATQFKTAFFIKGRTIYIGTKESNNVNVIDFGGKNYQYGKGKGLYEIEKVADTNQSIFTLLKVYGSDKNMPANYYADLGATVFFSVTKVESDIDDGDTQGLGLLIDNYIFAGVFTEHSGDPEYGSANYYKAVVTICKQTVTAWIEVLRNTDGATTRLVIGTDKYGTTAAQVKAIRDGGLAVGTPVYFDMDYVNKSKVDGSHIEYKIPSAVGALALPVVMLPGYPLQSLAEWWAEYKVSAGRDETYCQKIESYLIDYELSTDVNQPYIRSHKSSIYGLREQSWYFDGSDENHPEIYPTITGMKRGNVDLWKVSSAQQIADNGVLGNIEKAPTFTITIPALGFKVGGYLNDDTYIAFNSGMCGGRKFKVKKAVDYDNVSVLTCERSYDSSIGKWFPYNESGEAFNIQGGDNIRGGDEYVLLGIELPKEYVENAARRALLAGLEVLAEHDHPKSTYIPRIDEIEMERERDTHANVEDSLYWNLRAGQMFTFNDTDLGITVSREIATLTIKENGNNGIPTYEVALRENDEKGTLKSLQDRVDYIESNGLPDSTGTINGNATGGVGGDSLWEVHVDETTGERTAHLRSEFAGAWADGFLSALGKRSDGSDSGIILNEPLKGINEAGLVTPTAAQKDMTLVWNGTKWGYGKTGAYKFATGTENGTFLVTPYGGQAQKVSIFGLKALAYKDTIDATLVTSGIFSADRIPGLSWNKITSDKPNTLAGYGIGDAKIADGTITLGSNSITPVTEVKMTVPTGFAVTGSPLTKTGTLALAYAAGYEGFTTALKEKVEALFSWFELDSDGNVKTKDKPNGGGHRGFWTESFVSALGKNDSQSSAFDESAMWTALGGSLTNKQIALSHLTTALNGYVKGVKVGSTTYSPNGSGIVDLGTIEGRTYTFATGTKDGTFKVTPSVGDAYEVAIKGLGTLAYKASLTAADIPSLDATKITTGILSADRIPGLSADKITSGTLSVDRIPDLSGKYVTTTFFNKLFRAQDASGSDITVNAGTAVDSIKAMVGFWTEQYISALGKNDSSSDVVLNEPLLSINNGVYGTKAAGTAIVWDGSKWVYGKTGGEGTVTAVKVGSTTYSPTNGVVSLPAYPTSLAWGNITGKPTTIGDYGITDAKIENGVITLGANTITPLTDAKLKSGYEWWGQKLDASGKVNGNITIQLTTVDTNTYADANPKLIFKNANGSQNISLTFTDYDAVAYPASLTLNGNQGNELFIAPRMKADRLYLYKPNGSGDTNAVYLEYDSANGGVHLVGAGLYSDSYVSALGLSDSGSSSVFDEDSMWTALGTNRTNKLIASAYLGNVTKTLTIKDGNGTTLGTYNGTTAQTITVLSGNYLPLSGGTLTGNLYVGNTTIYASGSNGGLNSMLIGDDAYIGDCNHGGHLGIKSANGTTAGFYFYGKDNAQSSPIGYFTADNNVAKWNGNTMWHAGNDGANSGLDADLLDGQHGSYYGKASDVTTLQGYFTGGVANSAAKLSTVSKTLWGNTYWTAGGVPTDVGTASSPASLSNVVNITMSGSIGYKGTKATYQMIKFKDNTNDTYGNGVVIGGGGLVAIGGGESADVMAEQHAGGDENLMLGNDGAVDVYTNLQSGWASRKSFSFDTSGNFTLEGHVRLDNYKHIEIKNAGGSYLNVLTFTSSNQFVLGEGLQSYPTYLRGNTLTLQTGTSNAAALTINASGLVEVNQNTQGLKIGNAYLVWDSANNALKVTGASDAAVNFYATGGVSALGMGGSGGGGGVTLNEPLVSINTSSLGSPSGHTNSTMVWNGSSWVWSNSQGVSLGAYNFSAFAGNFNTLAINNKAVATQEWVTNNYIPMCGFVSATANTVGWGTLTPANGYSAAMNINAPDSSSGYFGYKDGQLSFQIDGLFYQNEGKFKVLDTNTAYISGQTITINGTSLTVPTGAGGDYLPLSGGTLTGILNLNFQSVNASETNNGISQAHVYPTTFNICDKYGKILTRMEADVESTGDISSYWYVRNYNTSGGQIGQKGIRMRLTKGGVFSYTVDEPDKFREAIGVNLGNYVAKTGDTMTGTLNINYSSGSAYALNVTGGFNLVSTSNSGILNAVELKLTAGYGIKMVGGASDVTVGDTSHANAVFAYGGFKKSGSSDSYVLLGGGGHKALSEFVRVHSDSISGNIYSVPCGTIFSGIDIADAPTTGWVSGIALGSNLNSKHYQSYLVESNNGNWYVTRNYQNGAMTNWKTLLDSNNYMQYVSAINNSANAGGGSAGWLRVAIIKVNATYTSQPIFMRIVQRGGYDGELRIYFSNQNTTDPTLNSLTYTGTLKTVKLIRYTAGTWHLYVQKSENYDAISVSVRDMTPYMQARVTVTYDNVFSSSEPTGTDFSNGSSGNWYAAREEFFSNGDGTMKIYGVSSGYGDERIAIQTSFDGQDPKTSTYPSSYPTRACLLLQPRGGNVGIGTTNPAQKLHVDGNVRITDSFDITRYSPTSGVYVMRLYTLNNANLDVNVGTGTASINKAWSVGSDMRLKNVNRHFELDPLTVARAPLFTYTLKDGGDKLMVGTSAQYWQEHLPETVTTKYDGFLSLDYNGVLTASVISVARKVVDHELRIKQLQDRVKELETELDELKAA